MLEISHNSCSIARACPMKYKWHYIDKLIPIKKPNAMALGSIVHEAFDMFYNGFSVDDVTKYITNVMDDQIAKASLPEQEDLIIIKYTALGMWINFPFKGLSEFKEIKSEEEFAVPMGDDVSFRGRSDRLVLKDSNWWIGELKTTGLSFHQFKNRMSTSDQVTAYVNCWRKLKYPVKGCMFDFIKKPLLRKGMNETCSDFAHRVAYDYKSRPKEYFGRHYEYRNDHVLKLWEEDTLKIIELIKGIWAGNVYRNTDACWIYNQECPYLKICFSEVPDPLTLQLYYTNGDKNDDAV